MPKPPPGQPPAWLRQEPPWDKVPPAGFNRPAGAVTTLSSEKPESQSSLFKRAQMEQEPKGKNDSKKEYRARVLEHMRTLQGSGARRDRPKKSFRESAFPPPKKGKGGKKGKGERGKGSGKNKGAGKRKGPRTLGAA